MKPVAIIHGGARTIGKTAAAIKKLQELPLNSNVFLFRRCDNRVYKAALAAGHNVYTFDTARSDRHPWYRKTTSSNS